MMVMVVMMVMVMMGSVGMSLRVGSVHGGVLLISEEFLVLSFGPVGHEVDSEGLSSIIGSVVLVDDLHVLGELGKSEVVLLLGSI